MIDMTKLPGNQGSMMITMFEQAAWVRDYHFNDIYPIGFSLLKWMVEFGTLRFSSIRQSGHTTGIFDLLKHVKDEKNYDLAKEVILIVPTLGDYLSSYRDRAYTKNIKPDTLNVIPYKRIDQELRNMCRSGDKYYPKLIIVEEASQLGHVREELLYEAVSCYAQKLWIETTKRTPPIIFFVH